MTNQAEQKAALRREARLKRDAAHAEGGTANAVATDLLYGFLKPFRGKVIAGYMPLGSEIDPRPLMHKMAKLGPVCVPIVEARAQPLRFDLWTPQSDLVEGAFGAMIPAHSEPVRPDVIIVPLLGFSREGQRLGYGGGFYDRTLEKLRKSGEVYAVGFAYSAQEVEDLVVEPTDAPLDAIVTERGIVTF
ncbi:5-formyltetrahydrofolate cyclo-ligase [Celeribacter litoreus]|uniref:5-formyltetrahydrofolate cyclo-ligase n=1 Tax=Celeribacter litoreus TaxID=2876714 RepID=UPI001CCDC92B|nr:5-formyltetrahydrofolate cyclo-ligase [Celeribacter litoreus]MCA0042951.1 5-formyltetrahydrofolate cyclo-ligase [Celeribacter litoreus]